MKCPVCQDARCIYEDPQNRPWGLQPAAIVAGLAHHAQCASGLAENIRHECHQGVPALSARTANSNLPQTPPLTSLMANEETVYFSVLSMEGQEGDVPRRRLVACIFLWMFVVFGFLRVIDNPRLRMSMDLIRSTHCLRRVFGSRFWCAVRQTQVSGRVGRFGVCLFLIWQYRTIVCPGCSPRTAAISHIHTKNTLKTERTLSERAALKLEPVPPKYSDSSAQSDPHCGREGR
jgi:hypothetical protein